MRAVREVHQGIECFESAAFGGLPAKSITHRMAALNHEYLSYNMFPRFPDRLKR
jgi:hypothetical protein